MERRLIKVQERPGIMKDPVSGALLNVDKKAIEAYREKKKILNEARQQSNEINNLRAEIEELRALVLKAKE